MGVMNDLLTNDLFPQALLPVTLQGPADLEGFRRAARGLLAQQMLPEQVSWHSSDTPVQDLFASPLAGAVAATTAIHNAAFANAPPVSVPPEYVTLCETAILHSDASRFGLLYRILWRLVHEPGLRHDPLDADMVKAGHMAQAVRRDMHKMKAFVRFRTVQDETFRNHPEGGPLHVAWFEPEHHIVEAIAPFFARRFTQMRWAVLTPERSIQWDYIRPHARHFVSSLPPEGASPALGRPGGGLAQLRFGPGASKSDAPPPDAGEKLWLTYYENIFNPARLKMKMMQKEMPRKYWHNLPEAALIAPLAAGAHARSARMVDDVAAGPKRRLPAIKVLPVTMASDEDAPERSLAQLREATNHCRECPIGACATQSVCGEGSLLAKLMFVGEQPGDQEDLLGRPFVGPAGQLLDRAFDELGIQRAQVFVSNAVKHFKYELRGKRRIHKTPSQREAAACQHWLDDEIAMVQPGLLVALGATAARSLLGRAVPVMAHRGQILERDDGRKVLVTLHPSALLRMPTEEREAAYAAWLADLSVLNGEIV
ncbi:UdgX family uracil-DNA binding protein [Polaromonas sp.]|uniref:UdgX family uracil-DNA binding protein n=1 Tax=Polaromonas sp. TaxID=1869339 RepID=UPI00248735B7|nr:UdgX family uracil-DNA binding protein [Polaromonas sp.]MDI1340240.1 UdgX family uracil-DNA binding protein [Polaromonas sp.]